MQRNVQSSLCAPFACTLDELFPISCVRKEHQKQIEISNQRAVQLFDRKRQTVIEDGIAVFQPVGRSRIGLERNFALPDRVVVDAVSAPLNELTVDFDSNV